MDMENFVGGIKDVITVKQVFGDAYEKEGVMIVPVASVRGGGGGGAGQEKENGSEGASGSGVGMGFEARPAGVYVIKEGSVKWQPAVNVNRIIAGAQLVAAAAAVSGIRRRLSRRK